MGKEVHPISKASQHGAERQRQRFSKELKLNAVKLVTEQGLTLAVLIYSAACAALRGFA